MVANFTFHIPKYVLGFSTNKGNSLCIFIFWQLLCVSPCDEWMATNLFSVVWKFTTCWFFGGLFLGTKYGRGFASPLTHLWLIESEILPCLSHLVIIERVGERDSLSPCHYHIILAYYYRPLTVKCIRVSYFLVTILKFLKKPGTPSDNWKKKVFSISKCTKKIKICGST